MSAHSSDNSGHAIGEYSRFARDPYNLLYWIKTELFMAEEQPSLHIDTDWKKQAQEEKRRLAEQEQKKPAQTPPPGTATPAQGGRARTAGGRPARELPPASFASLVNTLVTQALFYLGDLAGPGGEPVVNLDMSKHQIDTLSILEEKTKGNLNEEEQRLLDTALYETRMRYVQVASQYV
jgi:hypothetical protein